MDNSDKQKILDEDKDIIKYQTIESQLRDSPQERQFSSHHGRTNRGFTSGENVNESHVYPEPDWKSAFQGAEKLFRQSIPEAPEDGRSTYTKPSYANRKTMSQGAMDFALLMSNLAQLVVLLDVKDNTVVIKLLTVLTVLSIILQAVVAIMLTILAQMKVRTSEQETRAERMNEATAVLILIVSIINVVNSSMQIERNGTASERSGGQRPIDVIVTNRSELFKQFGNKVADMLP